jgi:hypothetical protein
MASADWSVRATAASLTKACAKQRKERTRTTFFVRTTLNASNENGRVASFSERKTLIFTATKEKNRETGGHRSLCGSSRALTPGPLESFIVVNQLLNITALHSALLPISRNLAPPAQQDF